MRSNLTLLGVSHKLLVQPLDHGWMLILAQGLIMWRLISQYTPRGHLVGTFVFWSQPALYQVPNGVRNGGSGLPVWDQSDRIRGLE
jgi:hypothetical protein